MKKNKLSVTVMMKALKAEAEKEYNGSETKKNSTTFQDKWKELRKLIEK